MKKLLFAAAVSSVTLAWAKPMTADEIAREQAEAEAQGTAYPAVTKAYKKVSGVIPGMVAEAAAKGGAVDEIEDSAVKAGAPQVAVAEPKRDPKTLGVAGPQAHIDISCDNATLAEVVTQFRRATRANIICADSPNLTRRVSATLVDVPWFPALSSLLNSRGFLIEERNGVYYVKEDVYDIPVRMRSYLLNHADAEEIANNINDMYAPRDKDGNVINPIAKCYKTANTLIITASEPVLEDCEKIIARIDAPVRQIYIEARFAELSSQAMHKLGLQWDSLQNYRVSVKNLSGGVEWNGGKAGDYGEVQNTRSESQNSNSSISDSSDAEGKGSSSGSKTESDNGNSSFTEIAATALNAATGAGRSSDSMGWKSAYGFGGQISADNFSLALSAFESMSDAKVFSNPKILVENGKMATVDMTTKFPNVNVSCHRSDSVTGPNYELSTELSVIPGGDKLDFAGKVFFEWGISLTVQPRISPDGLISVKIVPTISTLDEYYSVGQGVVDESSVVMPKFPVINMQRLITDFTLKDGSTAVIGGLSRTIEEDVDSGIPYLRKIPYVGQWLFGWKSRQKVQKEILVFVTVGIANPGEVPTDAGLPKNAVLGRHYVDGTWKEPGDREDAAKNPVKLDMRPLDERDGAVAVQGEKESRQPEASRQSEEPRQPEAKAAAEAVAATAAVETAGTVETADTAEAAEATAVETAETAEATAAVETSETAEAAAAVETVSAVETAEAAVAAEVKVTTAEAETTVMAAADDEPVAAPADEMSDAVIPAPAVEGQPDEVVPAPTVDGASAEMPIPAPETTAGLGGVFGFRSWQDEI